MNNMNNEKRMDDKKRTKIKRELMNDEKRMNDKKRMKRN
jgi:hypothetical protein